MVKNTGEISLLLVEDDDVDAINIERSFTKQRINNTIIRAHDGVEALELLRDGTVNIPYIILLDLQMPRMSGLEFLIEIRKDEKLQSSVIFVLTTSDDETDILKSYRNNIAGYFVKDETEDSFMKIVNFLDGYWNVVHLPKP